MSPTEVVRNQFAAFRSGGLDAVARLWHPEIEWRSFEGSADDVGLIRGHANLRRFYEDWIDTFDEFYPEVEEILVEEGDRVAFVVRNSGRGRASRVPVKGRYYVVCLVRDGQIVAGREYATRSEALEAIRLSA